MSKNESVVDDFLERKLKKYDTGFDKDKPKKDKLKRLNVEIPEALFEWLKYEASPKRRQNIRDLVLEALYDYKNKLSNE